MTKRIASAAIGIPIILGLTYAGGLWLEGLVLLVVTVAAVEAAGIMRQLGHRAWMLAVVVGSPLVAVSYFRNPDPVPVLLVLLSVSLFTLLLGRRFPPRDLLSGMALSSFFILFLGLSLSHWVLLRGLDMGLTWVFLALILTWANDTGAFFVGCSIGRTPLAPAISPAKTLEGSLGGLLGTLVIASGFGLWQGWSWSAILMVALLGGLAAQAGDLFVSLVKRAAGIKDSGALIPGHGGVLDRFDSLSLVMPVLYYLFSSRLF